MAIYHASTKPISRATGRSAVAAAAYRAGEKLLDMRTGVEHDYTRKSGVLYSKVMLPYLIRSYLYGGEKTANREDLWNVAEAAEKRKDARTAREWIVALPAKIAHNERNDLVITFACDLMERYGVAVDAVIHAPNRNGDNRNFHAHLLMTTRKVTLGDNDEFIFGEKSTLELSDKKRREMGLGSGADEITAIRELWANDVNEALLKNSPLWDKVDHRSLKAQGIDREPTMHLGVVATAIERRGHSSYRGASNKAKLIRNMLDKLKAMKKAYEKVIAPWHIITQKINALKKQKLEEDERKLLREKIERERRQEELENIERKKELMQIMGYSSLDESIDDLEPPKKKIEPFENDEKSAPKAIEPLKQEQPSKPPEPEAKPKPKPKRRDYDMGY